MIPQHITEIAPQIIHRLRLTIFSSFDGLVGWFWQKNIYRAPPV